MAHPIHRILFTTDLSKSSITVFEQTVMLASQLGASITMLHVIDDGSSSTQNRMVHLVDKEVYERIRKESQEHVKNILIGKQRAVPVIQNALQELSENASSKICGQNNEVQIDGIEVSAGNPAEVITEFSKGVDLVVMGFHKKGSLLRTLMGATGKNIIKESEKPIFLVPLKS
jgi:nucleotide-binding universal stress UspA family protein